MGKKESWERAKEENPRAKAFSGLAGRQAQHRARVRASLVLHKKQKQHHHIDEGDQGRSVSSAPKGVSKNQRDLRSESPRHEKTGAMWGETVLWSWRDPKKPEEA